MDSLPSTLDKDQLQKECIALREPLAENRLIRTLARKTRIHPSTLNNYLDGFCTHAPTMRDIIVKGKQLVADAEAKKNGTKMKS